MKSAQKKYVISVLLVTAVFIGLGLFGDLKGILDALKAFPLFYIPGLFFLAAVNIGGRFLKWEYCLARKNIELTKKESFVVLMAGLTMAVSPGRVGELMKPYLVKEITGMPKSESFPVVIAERVADVMAITILGAYGVFAFGYGLKPLVLCAALAGVFFLAVSSKSGMLVLIKKMETLPFVGRFACKAEVMYLGVRALMGPLQLTVIIIVSLISWLCECAAFYLILKGFAVDVSLPYAFFTYAVSVLIGVASMIPAGLGTTEGTMAMLLVLRGAPKSGAVAAIVLIRLFTLWLAVFLGLAVVFIWRSVLTGGHRVHGIVSAEPDREPEKP